MYDRSASRPEEVIWRGPPPGRAGRPGRSEPGSAPPPGRRGADLRPAQPAVTVDITAGLPGVVGMQAVRDVEVAAAEGGQQSLPDVGVEVEHRLDQGPRLLVSLRVAGCLSRPGRSGAPGHRDRKSTR